MVLLGKILECLVVRHLLMLHNEVDGTAAFPAAEAFAYSFRARDAERRCLFVMERAQPDIIRAAPAQMHEVGNDIHYVDRIENLIDCFPVYHLQREFEYFDYVLSFQFHEVAESAFTVHQRSFCHSLELRAVDAYLA